MEQMLYAASHGQRLVIAAGGIVYRSDRWDDTFPIGPEAPPPDQQMVDIGRGAWLMDREILDLFHDFPRLGSGVLTIPHHLAAALQLEGIPTVTLPYPLNERADWGMSSAPQAEGSMSQMLDTLASTQQGYPSAWHREEAYAVYRAAGWRPLCVPAAAAQTVREPVVDLGPPPPVYAAPKIAQPAAAAAPARPAPAPAPEASPESDAS